MANSIDGINGGGSSYNINWMRRNPENKNAEKEQPNVSAGIEQTPVNPDDIMKFMANNNFFVNPAEGVNAGHEVDSETQDRVAGYMERFEYIYGLVSEEFGEELGEELAPDIMDLVMDKFIGGAAA